MILIEAPSAQLHSASAPAALAVCSEEYYGIHLHLRRQGQCLKKEDCLVPVPLNHTSLTSNNRVFFKILAVYEACDARILMQ